MRRSAELIKSRVSRKGLPVIFMFFYVLCRLFFFDFAILLGARKREHVKLRLKNSVHLFSVHILLRIKLFILAFSYYFVEFSA